MHASEERLGHDDSHQLVERLTFRAEATASWKQERDHVGIIELDGNYDRLTPELELNVDPRIAAARAFYENGVDDFDFLVVFTSFPFSLTGAEGFGASAFYVGIRNDVQGIGSSLFDNSEVFGSAGRLQGYIDMGPLEGWETDPLEPGFSRVLGTLGHEVMHRFGARVRFRDPEGGTSEALLGRTGSHWSFLADTGRGNLMYGNDWRDNGDGTFDSLATRRAFSPLDLYLAGFLPPEAVPPLLLIESEGVDVQRLPEAGVRVTGVGRQVTLEEVLAVEGPRVPDHRESPKSFRAAFLFVLRPGEEPTEAQIAAIAAIRRAFQVHWSVLTGGRSVFHGFPASFTDLEPGADEPVGAGATRPVASLPDALAWLRSRQDADGSWADVPLTRTRDTATVAAALARLDPFFDRAGDAARWLQEAAASDTDSLARRARASRLLDRGSGALTAELLARQNDDGGWGLAPGHRSDPLDTALAVLALDSVPDAVGAVGRGADSLVGSANPDGSWGNAPGGQGRIGVTARVLEALAAAGRTAPVDAGLGWIAARQNPDGGFGDSPSTAHDTADALRVALRLGGADRIDSGAAVQYLRSTQTVEGSWEGSVHTTAMVADLLKFQEFGNLRFAESPTAVPREPFDGDGVEITVVIENDGSRSTVPTSVELFDGGPATGTRIAAAAIPELAPRARFRTVLSWDTTGETGQHRLTLRLDPENRVEELSETDNTAALDLAVTEASEEPDLELRSSEVVLDPAVPSTLPVELNLLAVVRNNGRAEVTDVLARLWRGIPGEGEVIAEERIDRLAGRSSRELSFAWTLEDGAPFQLVLEVDPDDVVAEAREDNNLVVLDVTPSRTLDLDVAADELALEGTPFLGNDVVFRVPIRNRGTADANNVTVRFLLEDETFTELSSRTLQLPAGTEVVELQPWTVDREGDLTLVVQLDPDNLVPESDESNNVARFEFTAGALGQPNLRLDSAGLRITPDPAEQGKPLRFEVTVVNNGGQEVEADVALFEGNPDQGGVELRRTTVGALSPQSSRDVVLELDEVRDRYDRFYFVVVDPDQTISEFDESDNLAFREVVVLGHADLAIASSSLRLTPRLPEPGRPVTLEVEVGNVGEQRAESVLVEVFDDRPEGGGALLASGTLGTIEAGTVATVPLQWTFAGDPPGGRLFVVVDRADAIPELDDTNNRASIAVSAGDGSVSVSERYLSPDGDGVQDATTLFWRLDSVQPVIVEVADDLGEIVRSEPQAAATDGSFEWDGRDARSRVVADGDYELRVLDSGGSPLRSATVTVDTNRSALLRAVGTPFESYRVLSCPLETHDEFVLSGDGTVFLSGSQNGVAGTFRLDPGTGDVRLLDARSPWQLAVTEDGSRVATWRLNESLRMLSGDGSERRTVPESGDHRLIGFRPGSRDLLVYRGFPGEVAFVDGSGAVAPRTVVPFSGSYQAVRDPFSPDGRFLRFWLRVSGSWSLQVVDLASDEAREVWSAADDVTSAWVPGRGLAVADSPGSSLVVLDDDGVELERFELPPAPEATGEAGAVVLEPVALDEMRDLRVAPSGRELLVRAEYRQETAACTVKISQWLHLDLVTGDWQVVAHSEGCQIGASRSPEGPQEKSTTAGTSSGVEPRAGHLADEGQLLGPPLWLDGLRHVVSEGSIGTGLMLDRERWVELFAGWSDIDVITASADGTRLFFESRDLRSDPENDCPGPSFRDDLVMLRTLENLTVEMTARPGDSGALEIEGTVADAHLESWWLDYASVDDPEGWRRIETPRTDVVIDDRLTLWVPPRGGSYLVRLTARDRAGNESRVTRQVGVAETASLANIEVGPRLISPNDDGILDRLLVSYDVILPAHVEVLIRDAERNPVRSLSKNEPLAGVRGSISWDGRDDRGLPVPDGRYGVKLLGLEYFFTIDTTPPSVRLDLTGSVALQRLRVEALDEHLEQGVIGTVERGEGSLPAAWSFVADVEQTGTPRPDSEEAAGLGLPLARAEYVGFSFRASIRDAAGNLTVATIEPPQERVQISLVGPDLVDPETGDLAAPLEEAFAQGVDGPKGCSGPDPVTGEQVFSLEFCSHLFPPDALRMRIEESVIAPVARAFVQYRPFSFEAAVEPPPWQEVELFGFLEPSTSQVGVVTPPETFDLVWDLAGVDRLQWTVVRLRLLDDQGKELVTAAFRLFPRSELRFGGRLPAPEERVEVYELLEEAELDPLDPDLLWAVEFAPGTLENVVLTIVSRPDEPYDADERYAVETSFQPIALTDGAMFFAVPTRSCAIYDYRLSGESVPVQDPRTGAWSPGKVLEEEGRFASPCLDLEIDDPEKEYGVCGAPGPWQGRWFVELRPESLDGVALKSLTVEGPWRDPDATVLANVNAPISGELLEIELDTSTWPEGQHLLVGRLTNERDEERVALIEVQVDRTAPELEITFPADNQRICGSFEVEGRAFDAQGFNWTSPSADSGGLRTSQTQTVGVLTASQTLVEGTEDQVLVQAQIVNSAGQRVCAERTVFVDAGVQTLPPTFAGYGLSPNGDGLFETLPVTLGTIEPVFVDVGVFTVPPLPGSTNPFEGGSPVRWLARDLPLSAGSLQLLFDGRGEDGQVLPDGGYQIVARYRDACGNVAHLQAHDVGDPTDAVFVIDTTPPALEIVYPETDSELPVVVEVLGGLREPDSDRYGAAVLEVGEGLAPTRWLPIRSWNAEELERGHLLDACPAFEWPCLLGRWNISDLSGDFVLRLRATDRLANSAELLRPVAIDVPVQLIGDLEPTPDLFSPNGDGRRETTALRFLLNRQVEIDLVVKDAAGDTIVRRLLGSDLRASGAWVESWDGRDDAGRTMPDGLYRVELTARLPDGAAETATVTVGVDATPPELAVTRPAANGWVTGSADVLGTVADANLSSRTVEIALAGSASWRTISEGGPPVEDGVLASFADLPDQPHVLRLRAGDAADNESELVVPFSIDGTPPVVTLSTPEEGRFLSAAAGAASVTGSIEEDHLASWRLRLEGEGGSAVVLAEGASAGALTETFDPGAFEDGPYTLVLEAVDLAGSSGEASRAIVIDNTPPTVAVLSPQDGATIGGRTSITGTASDAHLALYTVEVAPGTPASAQQWSTVGQGTTAVEGSQLLDWTSLPPDGRYALRLSALDRAGNRAEIALGVEVDLTPPPTPLSLRAEVENRADARLDWLPVEAPDLAGYHVQRDGERITAEPLPDTTWLDRAPGQGTFGYTVTAVDRAGNESDPSNRAEVLIDTTPPDVDLTAPAAGARVRGEVEIRGRAHSQDDFAEYRLFASAPGDGSRALIRRSSVPVLFDTLGFWNSLDWPEGAPVELRLEAEDLSGNVGTATVTVTVDNLPPAAPTGLVAEVDGADIDVRWDANSEPDLAGYLLYRDGRLVNAATTVAELLPYALEQTLYRDLDRPDGTFTYRVHAIDRAGNVSPPSAPADATVERRPPRALIVEPASGDAFEDPVYLRAESEDRDLVRVEWQVFAPDAPSWTLFATDLEAPWETTFDPQTRPYGDYRFRAVAFDAASSDSAPEAIDLVYRDLRPPDRVLDIAARVDGGRVTVEWSAVEADDLAGYHVERSEPAGVPVRLTADPVTTTTYVDEGVADGDWQYVVVAADTTGNEAVASEAASAWVFTPRLEQPLTPTWEVSVDRVAGSAPRPGELSVEAEVEWPSGVTPLAADPSDVDGRFVLSDVPLERGRNAVRVRLRDAEGNRSKIAAVPIDSAPVPTAPDGIAAQVDGFDVELSWNPHPSPDVAAYRVFRDGDGVLADRPVESWAEVSASSVPFVSAGPGRVVDGSATTYWTPGTGTEEAWIELRLAQPAFLPTIELTWLETPGDDGPSIWAPKSWQLQAWSGEVWVPLLSAAGSQTVQRFDLPWAYATDRLRVVVGEPREGRSQVRLAEVMVLERPTVAATTWAGTLPDGRHELSASAVHRFGFESLPGDAAVVEIGDAEPPPPVVLSGIAEGSDALLSWTASAAADLARYDLWRDDVRIAQLGPSILGDRDAALANGSYRYVVTPVDAVGNVAPPSNEVTVVIDVAVPGAPIELQVTGAEADALTLAWSAGGGAPPSAYRLYRSATTGGPYDPVAVVTATEYRDGGLETGVDYYYVVAALDGVGNESAVSNEASGTPADGQSPDPPSLFLPVGPGVVLETRQTTTTVVGFAEPGATVELLREGRPQGRQTARAAVGVASVAGNAFRVSGSPDGRRAVITSFQLAQVVDFESGARRALGERVSAVSWGRAGELYHFLEGRFGSPGELRRLDAGGENESTLASFDRADALALSPDGSSLAVAGVRDGLSGAWILDLETGEWSEPLAFGSTPTRLAWSPAGGWLAALSATGVTLFDLEDGSTRAVIDEALDQELSWSADGRTLFFVSWASGPTTGWIYDVAGDQASPLPAGDFLLHPSLSPDGQRWARVETDGVVISALDGSRREVVVGDALANHLHWAPSGDLIVASPGEIFRYRLPGRFVFADRTLEPGETRFSARAFDGAGNRSDDSEAIVVRLLESALPNLTVRSSDLVLVPETLVVGDAPRLTARVANEGAEAAGPSAATVVLVAPDGSRSTLVEAREVPALSAGDSATLSVDFAAIEPGMHRLVVVADVGDRVREADETDNLAERSFEVLAEAGPRLSVTTDRSRYQPGEEVVAQVELVNAGPTIAGDLVIRVEDADGFEAAELLRLENQTFDFGVRVDWTVSWPTDGVFAGPYRVVARLVAADGTSLVSDGAAFVLGESFTLSASLGSDRARYVPPAEALLTGRVAYPAGNAPLAGLEARLSLEDESGATLEEWRQPLATLLPEASATVTARWSSAGAAEGVFTAVLSVRSGEDGADEVAHAETTFEVAARPAALEGALALPASPPAVGEPMTVGWQIRNVGGVALPALPVRVVLRSATLDEELGRSEATVDLAPAGTAGGEATFATADLDLSTYVVQLLADLPDGRFRTVTLDSANVSLADLGPPELELLVPEDGGFVGIGGVARLRARDRLSQVESVELAFDGGSWRQGPLVGAEESVYGLDLGFLEEGPHALSAVATDTWNNRSAQLDAAFTVDRTPPVIRILGVVDGQQSEQLLIPVIEIEELHPGTTSITLDGRPFASGTPVATVGSYRLEVVSSDRAGNRSEAALGFQILPVTGPPQVTITAPADTSLQPATLELRALVSDDGTVAAVEAAVDGGAGAAMTEVTAGSGEWTRALGPLAEGERTLTVRARDDDGLETAASVRVTVDATPPVIRILGVADGDTVVGSATPVVEIDEPHPGTSTVELDGQPYTSGTPVSEQGPHTLVVVAVDAVGNRAERSVSFTVEAEAQEFVRIDGPLTGARLDQRTVDVFGTTLPGALVGLEIEAPPGSTPRQLPPVKADGDGTFRFATVALDHGTTRLTAWIAGSGSAKVTGSVLVTRPEPQLAALLQVLLEDDLQPNGVADAGDSLRYELELWNHGEGSAFDLEVEIPLPDHTSAIPSAVSVGPSGVLPEVQASWNGDRLAVTLSRLAPGESRWVEFQVRIDSPLPPDVVAIETQGTVRQADLLSQLTDDPSQPGAADATRMPLGLAAIPALDDLGRVVLIASLLLLGVYWLRRRQGVLS